MTKRVQTIRAGRFTEVPPWCYWRPGMSPEAAALTAAKALGLTHPMDLLNLLWMLRRLGRERLWTEPR
jgi:hypothetical protein